MVLEKPGRESKSWILCGILFGRRAFWETEVLIEGLTQNSG